MMAELSGGKLTLWQFLLELLMSNEYSNLIKWTDRNIGEFILIQAEEVAKLWGIRKDRNHRMNYDKLSRALRYYYQKNIIKKVHGHKFVYRFVSLLPEMIPGPSNSFKPSNSQCDSIHATQQQQQQQQPIILPDDDQLTNNDNGKPRSICSGGNRSQQSISNSARIPNKNLKKSDFNSTLSALFQAALLSLSGCNSELAAGLFPGQHKESDQCICSSSDDNRNTPSGSRIFDMVGQTSVSPRHECICQPDLPILSNTANTGLFIPGSACSASHIQPLPFDRQSLLHFSRHSINMQRLSQEILLHSCNNSKPILKPHLSNQLLGSSGGESVDNNIIDSSHPNFWLNQFAQDLYNSANGNHHNRPSNNDKVSPIPPPSTEESSDIMEGKIKTEKLSKASPLEEGKNLNSLTALFQQFVKDLESRKAPVIESSTESNFAVSSHAGEYSHSDLANLIKSQLENHSSFVWMPIPVKFAEEIMKYCIKSGPEIPGSP